MNLIWENLFIKDRQGKAIRNLLASNFIFEDLGRSELSFLKSLIHVRTYKPGEYLFRQGEVGVGMFIILSGNIDITVDESSLRSGTESIYVTKLEPGDFFGEISLIEENERRTANAIAHNEVTVLGFFRPDLLELVDRNPTVGIKIYKKLAMVLGRRLKETSSKVTQLKKEMNRGG